MEGLDTFPAFPATFASLDEGKAEIAKRREQPLRLGAWVEGGLALATGLCRPLPARRHRCWVGGSAGGPC